MTQAPRSVTQSWAHGAQAGQWGTPWGTKMKSVKVEQKLTRTGNGTQYHPEGEAPYGIRESIASARTNRGSRECRAGAGAKLSSLERPSKENTDSRITLNKNSIFYLVQDPSSSSFKDRKTHPLKFTRKSQSLYAVESRKVEVRRSEFRRKS